MQRLGLVGAPVLFAFRRMRGRPLSVATVFLAAAAAAGLIGWSGLAAAQAQEDSVRLRLRELTPDRRALRVVSFTQPFEQDVHGEAVEAALRSFERVTSDRRLVRIWHPIVPPDERGTRLVLSREPAADVIVAAGRLPGGGCRASSCPALALAGGYRLGRRVRLGRTVIRIVGVGFLRPVALGDPAQLGSRALLVRSTNEPLRRLLRAVGSTSVATAPLDPDAVHGFELDSLRERLRRAVVRLDRSDPNGLVRATAPLEVLGSLAERGRTARERLLLVAGEAAALIVAFAAFATAARRRETLLAEDQLETLGASRTQVALARATETAAPSLAGAGVAVGGLVLAAELVARSRGLPSGFVSAALPLGTILTIVAVAAAAAALLAGTAGHARASRRGVGALELAALAALGIVVWQSATTGGLDPDQVAREGADPVLVLLPALAFFVTGVALMRVLPPALRLVERPARRASFAVRLGFLGAARRPAQAAATTTFLAVALGASLFSLDYRATLDGQARDEAAFAAGAEWRVAERAPGRAFGATDVTPLTRFARVSGERPTPALRLDATLRQASPTAEPLPLRVLALPAGRIRDVRGWRDGFSPLPRERIASLLRPRPVRLTGPPIARDATALRVWILSESERPRVLVLHFLLPGQGFAHVRVGLAWRRWRRLSVPIPPALRGSQLVGVEFLPTLYLLGRTFDLQAYVDLGRFEEKRPGGWSPLPALGDWTAAAGDEGGYLVPDAPFPAGSPVAHGVEFDLNGTNFPLIRPSVPLPPALPALASGPVAAQAVDRVATLDLEGNELAVRVVGTARLFPTVVERPSSFVVLDYDTLFAALNADRPGTAVPSEAWFFEPQEPRFRDRLDGPQFRLRRAVGARALEARLLDDPLARGTRDVLGAAALAAAALALLGLVLAARSTLTSERLLLAEYEALGVPPRVLARSTQVRLVALSLVGVVAGFAGALLAVRLVGAFVAVTGSARRPLPPIAPHVAATAGTIVLVAVAAAGLAAVALLAARAFRETAARRLRA
jgi:hypothetical protein